MPFSIPTAQKTPLFGKKVPGGALVITDESFTTGNRFFVHSGTGTNAAGYGWGPDAPFASLAYAFSSGVCTAAKGDFIHLMPGHAEAVSAAAGIVASVAGVTVKGIGSGTSQPKITFDTIITADLDVDAANITFDNIHFTANFADITAAIDVNATDCTIRNCRFSETAVNMNAVIWILGGSTTTSNRLRVENCNVLDKDAANTHFVSMPGTDDGNVIRNNVLQGDWGTAAIGAAGNITNIAVIGNYIFNTATDNDAMVNIATAGTGIVANNSGCGGAAQANGFLATGCAKINNLYGVIAEDASAILDPIAT